jgi:hypothetical protein
MLNYMPGHEDVRVIPGIASHVINLGTLSKSVQSVSCYGRLISGAGVLGSLLTRSWVGPRAGWTQWRGEIALHHTGN